MSAQHPHLVWKSCGTGACVEIAHEDATVYMRDSMDPSGPRLTFSREDWLAFLAGVRAGEYDVVE